MSGVSEHRPADGRDGEAGRDPHTGLTAADRVVKQAEWWSLLRSAVPLIAAGLGISWLYSYFAASSDVGIFWLGPALGVPGSICAVIGYRGRLREIRSTRPSDARHYPWLFIGWVLVAAAALVPPYASA